jgi:hypothetical protein
MNPNPGLLMLFVSVIGAGQPTVPPLLKQAMRHLPGLRLLDPTIDLAGGYTVEELRSFGFWPPWVTIDLDRDGRPDVAAVVVKPGAKPQFGVIALHARSAGSIQWIATLGDSPINGVSTGPAADTLTPLYCVECDGNSWFRWSGRSYETELYAVGEKLETAERETDHGMGLFAKPSRDSTRVFPIEACQEATVRRVAGSAKDRWYFVETNDDRRVRGWIPGSLVAGSGECMG